MGLIALNVENAQGIMEIQSANLMAVGEDFLPTLGIDLLEGRDFSQKFLTDIGQSMLVNQALVDAMGWGNQAIGKRMEGAGGPGLNGRVIGVVDDFNYASLYQDIGPLIMMAPQADFSNASAENRALGDAG